MIKIINIVLFAGMIVMNYLANALPMNNHTTGSLSDSYPNLFVPAGITFSIWGIIYLLIASVCIIQYTGPNQDVILSISWLFALTCIFNSLWIVCWHYIKLPLSLVIMTGLLVSLILINMKLAALPNGFIKAAFGVYLGWICIATIANATALLVHYKWDGFGIPEVTWTIAMVAAGAVIASLAIIRFNNPFIGFSVAWAFAGIIIKRQADHRSIAFAAGAALVFVCAITLWAFLKKTNGGV